MTRHLRLSALFLVLSAAVPLLLRAQTGDATEGAGAPAFGSFGFDTAGMDRSVAPGDDFYGHANGAWMRATTIPEDRPAWGASARLREIAEERTRTLIQEAAAGAGTAHGAAARQVGDFYASFMDEAEIERRGLAPIQPLLSSIAAISTPLDLARAFGAANRDGLNPPLGISVHSDLKASDRHAVYLEQGGLGLPDREYYLDAANARFGEVRARYEQHVARMLALAAFPDASRRAQRIVGLERRIAEAHWTRVDSRQVDKIYNPTPRGELAAAFPGLEWDAFLRAAGVESAAAVIIGQPSAIAAIARLAEQEPLETWRDYLSYHAVSGLASVLPRAFVEEDFELRGRLLSGTPQQPQRWKRGIELVNSALGEAVGQLYVARHFPPDAKAKADELVRNLIAAMDTRLQRLEWMAPETKTAARAKLAAFRAKIGYPERWRDYSRLQIAAGDAYGNVVRARRFEYQRNVDKIGTPVDRDEWLMTPQTVNAYANAPMNEIVFPAGILQPPYFDPHADPAVNYGAIGAVIGHEISHHFDDQGRKFDVRGHLADWWTAGDVERFKGYTDRLVKQYGEYEPLPGSHVNGELTLGENIADLAGVMVAYDGYQLSLRGQPAPVLEGFTGDQRFFLGYAQVWRSRTREEYLLRLLTTDTHTPASFRPYVVRNVDAWYTAFDVRPGQKMYLAPDQRVRVW